MRLYVLRHGQTNYNLLGLCSDDPREPILLTETGEAQAAEAAERLRGAPLERIYTSELPRTRQTAEIVNRWHGAPVAADRRLNDWRTGLNGRPVAELYAAIATAPMHTRLSGGETLAEHHRRVHSFLDWVRDQPFRCVLVVAHEETLRAVSAYCRALTDAQMLTLTFANGELLEFELEPGARLPGGQPEQAR